MDDTNRNKNSMTPADRGISTIYALELVANSGDWDLVDFMLSRESARLIDLDPDSRGSVAVRDLRQRLAEARKWEETHGKGSLLNPDHPFNSKMAEIAEAQMGKPTEIYFRSYLRK